MRLEDEQPICPRIVGVGQIQEVHGVAQRLGHLLPPQLDEAVVHPVLGEGVTHRHRLSPLVLVVGETEVEATGVQVESLSQQVEAHDNALGVPTRSAFAPRRWPGRFARFGQLPEREVARVPLLGRPDQGPISPALDEIVQGLMGQQAVVPDRCHRQVDAIGGRVGRVLPHQVGDELDHCIDVLGGVRDEVGSLHVDAVHGPEPDLLALVGDLSPVTAFFLGSLDDLVLDVGDVRHEGHLETGPDEVAAQAVIDQGHSAVPHVRGCVHRRPAHVDRDLPGIA